MQYKIVSPFSATHGSPRSRLGHGSPAQPGLAANGPVTFHDLPESSDIERPAYDSPGSMSPEESLYATTTRGAPGWPVKYTTLLSLFHAWASMGSLGSLETFAV